MPLLGDRSGWPEPEITCIDCGGRAHLLTIWDDEDPPAPGDLATYRCEDCLDRWDLLVPDPDEPVESQAGLLSEAAPPAPPSRDGRDVPGSGRGEDDPDDG